jgi:hypothetical protein
VDRCLTSSGRASSWPRAACAAIGAGARRRASEVANNLAAVRRATIVAATVNGYEALRRANLVPSPPRWS